MAKSSRFPKKEGPQTLFAWAVDEGVQAYRLAKKLPTLELVQEEIGQKAGIGIRVLQNWRQKAIPIDYEKLKEFARVCVEADPKLGEDWVTRLFREANMAGYQAQAIQDIFGITPSGEATEQTEDVSLTKTEEPPTPQEVYPVEELEGAYKIRLREWAINARLVWGERGDISRGYIHSRLKKFLPLSQVSETEVASTDEMLFAEQLLVEKVRAAIIGEAGSGKSMLWRHLSRLVADGIEGDVLPIPIDLQWPEFHQEDIDILEVSIDVLYPDCPADGKRFLISSFQGRLQKGDAIALVDNWEAFEDLPKELRDQLRRLLSKWPRVVLFSRHPINPHDVQVESYSLTPLGEREIRRFIRTWPLISDRQLDVEAVISQLDSPERADWLNRPLFLDLLCFQSYRDPGQQHKRWLLLRNALDYLTGTGNLSDADIYLFRAMLSELAWQGYLCAGVTGDPYSFSAVAVYQLWRSEIGSKGEKFFDIAVNHGLLCRRGERLAFPHPDIQAILAAKQWQDEPNWPEHLLRVKSQPLWANVIIFAAAQMADSILGKARQDSKSAQSRAVAKLEEFLNQLCSSNGSDTLEMNWLLAGRCLAELSEDARELLESLGVGARIRLKLVELLRNPPCYSMFTEVLDLLPLLRTRALVEQMGCLALDRHQERSSEIKILGRLGGPVAVNALISIVTDSGRELSDRMEAAQALGYTRDERAVPILKQLLEEDKPLDIPQALAAHNSPQAARVLLNQPRETGAVISAIERLSNPTILPILEEELSRGTSKALPIMRAVAHIGGKGAVEILARLLSHHEQSIADHAARLLGEMRTSPACQALIAFAEDSQQPRLNRYNALSCLPQDHGLWDPVRVIDLLFHPTYAESTCAEPTSDDSTSDPEWMKTWDAARAGAFQALTRTADANLCIYLRRALEQVEQVEDDARGWLISVLAEAKRQALAPLLLNIAQNDPDRSIRCTAICGLGRLRHPCVADLALEELQQALLIDEPVGVLHILCETLGEIKEKRAIPIFKAMIESGKVPTEAIEALGDIGGTEAAEALIDIWRKWRKGECTSHQDDIIEALVQIGDPLGIQEIIDTLTRPGTDWPERQGLEHLRHVKNPAAIDVLVEALSHADPDVRGYAAEAVGYFGALGYNQAEKAIPQLVSWLSLPGHEMKWLRDQAAEAIKKQYRVIQDPLAVEALIEALSSPDEQTRFIGLVGLQKIPPDLVTDKVLSSIRQVLMTESPRSWIFREAVKNFGILGRSEAVPLLGELLCKHRRDSETDHFAVALAETGDPLAVPLVLDICARSTWHHLARLEFLPALVAKQPKSHPVLCRFCLHYDIRVMPDSTIMLPDGESVPCDKAVRWLKARDVS